ncbi:MAG: response regulator [Gammaproteobacteria bacterium]|nr:response regulator [Gammaproteobacteria bacterium]
MQVNKTVHILLVEDDEVDATAFQRSLKKHKVINPIVRAHDGIEALEILRGQHTIKIPSSPLLIILDLNMPRMNGLEFLDQLRGDDSLKHHIVFMLTTSNDDRDRIAAYNKFISGYIVKSNAGENFMSLVELIDDFVICVQFP